ncbi:putative transporter small subunit [Streptomyces tagetis]|uniref:Transporter small subunit n=1 Tax=Streptomyces tagetis TaxID=2820809 RepID=A0A940XAD2_9ACTN|nr:putative transporter small subunit [Streptomyces sp. RG38]MBQ0826503.1 putative transporter small subunit [Streptomyces sp. RG38]
MSTVLLSAYVLMWPVLVAVVLFVISRGFFREWAEARRNGRDLI